MQSDTSKGINLGFIISLRDTMTWIEVLTFSFSGWTFKHYTLWEHQELSHSFELKWLL